MSGNYLELAAAELRIAKQNLDAATYRMTPDQTLKYEQRLRIAEGFTKLAAIQAGLPPCGCQPPVTPEDGKPDR